jgi:negative regulator of replication initiation
MTTKNQKTNANETTTKTNANLTIEQINNDETLRKQYVETLLKQLSNDDTSKNDKRTIRRFLRSLKHTGGLKNSQYRKTKSINDFVKTIAK